MCHLICKEQPDVLSCRVPDQEQTLHVESDVFDLAPVLQLYHVVNML